MIKFHLFCYDAPDISSCSSKRNTNSDNPSSPGYLIDSSFVFNFTIYNLYCSLFLSFVSICFFISCLQKVCIITLQKIFSILLTAFAYHLKNFFSKSLKVNPFSFSIVISHKSPYHWSLTNLIIRFLYVIDCEEF